MRQQVASISRSFTPTRTQEWLRTAAVAAVIKWLIMDPLCAPLPQQGTVVRLTMVLRTGRSSFRCRAAAGELWSAPAPVSRAMSPGPARDPIAWPVQESPGAGRAREGRDALGRQRRATAAERRGDAHALRLAAQCGMELPQQSMMPPATDWPPIALPNRRGIDARVYGLNAGRNRTEDHYRITVPVPHRRRLQAVVGAASA